MKASLGYGVMEGGDDIWVPAVGARFSLNSGIFGSFSLRNRSYPIVLQEDQIYTLGYEWSKEQNSSMSFDFGLSYLLEKTAIVYSSPQDTWENKKDEQTNLGLNFSVHYRFFLTKGIYLDGGWLSYLFFPSFSAGILFSSIRSQHLLLSFGGEW